MERIVQISDGYPYFLQEFGSATWLAATGPRLTHHDAEVRVRLGTATLDGGFFRSRWDRATPTEREYMIAMAIDGDEPSRSTEVAARMGRTASNVRSHFWMHSENAW